MAKRDTTPVASHFFNTTHAVVSTTDTSVNAVAERQSKAYGDLVRFYLQVANNGLITTARFQALGSPVTIAACNLVAQWLEGKTSEQAATLPRDEFATALEIDATSHHILILINHCVNDALAQV